MSNINKQALREMAERAASDSWGYDRDEFNDAITPSTVLALLDELEAAEERVTELSQKADIYDMLRQDYELQGSLVDFVDWQAKRIAELEAREVELPAYRNSPDMHTKQYYEAVGFNQGLDACTEVLRATGISVKGE
ncbi:TPA: ead/Ea22-like family protein [Enterobacter hormaechei subsp. oharae]|nr:ead/Ea22-like family protein [Enterobacter hormaechei subsp. oharae]HED1577331.1 ead/Ea22-like family protein [Enterobacter hormaechei subsp. oharae]